MTEPDPFKNAAPGDGTFCTDIAHAQLAVLRYVADEVAHTHLPEEDLTLAYRFSYDVLKKFFDGITDLRNNGEDIQYIRIYHSKTARGSIGEQLKKNVVVAPVKGNGEDYYDLYTFPGELLPTTFVFSNGTPCPNVCQMAPLLCQPLTNEQKAAV